MLAGIISGLFSFFLFMIGHVIWFHVKPDQDRSKIILRIFLLAVLLHCVLILMISIIFPNQMREIGSSEILSIIAGLILMLCMFILYMPFYYTLNTSLSVETLAMIKFKGEGQLPEMQVRDRFTSESFLLDRLETMCRNGYLKQSSIQDKSYLLQSKGQRIAKTMLKVKNCLKLGPGG